MGVAPHTAMRLAIAFLILAVLVTVGISGHAGGWKSGPVDPFTLWAVSPYGAFALLCLAVRNRPIAARISAVGSILAAAFGMVALIDGFFFHLDAQNGLLFIFVPLYQWAGWVFFALLSAFGVATQKAR